MTGRSFAKRMDIKNGEKEVEAYEYRALWHRGGTGGGVGMWHVHPLLSGAAV